MCVKMKYVLADVRFTDSANVCHFRHCFYLINYIFANNQPIVRFNYFAILMGTCESMCEVCVFVVIHYRKLDVGTLMVI